MYYNNGINGVSSLSQQLNNHDIISGSRLSEQIYNDDINRFSRMSETKLILLLKVLADGHNNFIKMTLTVSEECHNMLIIIILIVSAK